MRNAFSALLLLTAILFFSVGVLAQQDPVPPTATGAITGTVTASDGVTPLASATLTLRYQGSNIATTITNGSGVYTFTGLATGDYRVGVVKANYISEFYDNQLRLEYANVISVTDGSTRTNINFALDLASNISGRVTALDGVTPISNALVEIYFNTLVGGQALPPATTAADGTYTIPNVPPGSYHLFVVKNNYVAQFYNNQTFRLSATTLTVVQGQTITDINFALPVTASVSGRVTQADGVTPIEGVSIFVTTQCNQATTSAVTGADGTYTTDGLPFGLPTGNYTIRARKAGYADEYYDNQWTMPTVHNLPLTAGTLTSNINFTLDAGGTITGKITAADGITPITVPYNPVVYLRNVDGTQVLNPSNGFPYFAQAGMDGTYIFTGVPIGNFIVQSAHIDYTTEYYPNQTTLTAAQPVSVTPNTTTPNINFALDVGGKITGTVLRSDGTNPGTSPVEVVTPEGVVIARTDTIGGQPNDYTFYGLPPGNYHVRSGLNYSYGVEYYPNQPSAATASLVTVTAGATTPNINFSLDAVYGVLQGSFTVAGLTSEYFRNAPYPLQVTVTPTGGGSPVFEGMVDVRNQQPQFYVERILPGNYTVTVRGTNTLSVTKTDVTVSEIFTVIYPDIGFLRGGDVDGSNLVNITDFSLLATSFGKVFCEPGFDARADFNRDNRVNITDFSILATYFGQSG